MERPIKIKAVCLIENGDKILVADGETLRGKPDGRPIIPDHFYRVLGGSLNFSESAEEGVRREIREEVDSEIDNLEKLDVIENIFTYHGEPGHEIVFLFKGTLARTDLLGKETVPVVENDYTFDARWVSKDDLLKKEKPLYPTFDYKKFF